MSAGPPGAERAGGSRGLRTPEAGGAKNAPSSEERALLRQLKEVTDRQRDELRAHSRDLLRRSQETEAVRARVDRSLGAGPQRASELRPLALSLHPQLQEQLQRLLLVNSELRHKLAAVQTQLRTAQDRERESQITQNGSRQLAEEQRPEPEAATPDDPVRAGAVSGYIPELNSIQYLVGPAWVCHAVWKVPGMSEGRNRPAIAAALSPKFS